MDEPNEIVERVALKLGAEGGAHIRTGDRRSVAKARKIAKEAAELAEVDVSTSDKGGYLLVTVK